MQTIETSQCESLGRTLQQAKTTKTITVAEHCKAFFAFDTCDVWTADGWLVTAVQSDGKTHHLRKGQQRRTATAEADEILHYTPNAKSLRWTQS